MKKFFEEFKAFALKGNMMDMAIGVIIGGAFSTLVTSLTDNLISPILGILGKVNFDAMMWDVFGDGKLVFKYGAFITAVINFLIMAFVLFCIVKAMNKLMEMGKHEEPAAEEPAAPAAPTQEELLTEALLGAENTGRDVQLFMNRMEHDDYRSVPELYQAGCPECGAPLQNDEVWLKRGNTGYFTRAVCPYCGHWYLRFKLSRRDGLHWSFARCIDPATPEYDAKWDKQKAALLERMKRKQERNIKE